MRFEVSGTRRSLARGGHLVGQVISSPPGPSGEPFLTHLLPGGGIPRVHGAQSPVPPWLPLFATPRSVRHLATAVPGAYPLRRPPNAWSPGVPAPPGLCYWLVASGTPLGWCGGCLAVGLVRGTVCHYCLGRCSAVVVCVRRSRQVWGYGAGAGSRVSPVPPPPSSALPVLCVAGRFLRVSLIIARWYAIPCGLCVLRARSSRPSGSPRVPVACVCVRAPAVSAPFPPARAGVARAPRVVPVQGAGRAVPCGSCHSTFPTAVPCAV